MFSVSICACSAARSTRISATRGGTVVDLVMAHPCIHIGIRDNRGSSWPDGTTGTCAKRGHSAAVCSPPVRPCAEGVRGGLGRGFRAAGVRPRRRTAARTGCRGGSAFVRGATTVATRLQCGRSRCGALADAHDAALWWLRGTAVAECNAYGEHERDEKPAHERAKPRAVGCLVGGFGGAIRRVHAATACFRRALDFARSRSTFVSTCGTDTSCVAHHRQIVTVRMVIQRIAQHSRQSRFIACTLGLESNGLLRYRSAAVS